MGKHRELKQARRYDSRLKTLKRLNSLTLWGWKAEEGTNWNGKEQVRPSVAQTSSQFHGAFGQHARMMTKSEISQQQMKRTRKRRENKR
jgi:hypothetical protein